MYKVLVEILGINASNFHSNRGLFLFWSKAWMNMVHYEWWSFSFSFFFAKWWNSDWGVRKIFVTYNKMVYTIWEGLLYSVCKKRITWSISYYYIPITNFSDHKNRQKAWGLGTQYESAMALRATKQGENIIFF